MTDKNYRDEFEFFLKESADEYKMVPSRKTWYSIYNNLHPDRKWPSMAICLLILSAVLYIGIANNNSISQAARKTFSQNFNSFPKLYSFDTKNTFFLNDYLKISAQQFSISIPFTAINYQKNIDETVREKQNVYKRNIYSNKFIANIEVAIPPILSNENNIIDQNKSSYYDNDYLENLKIFTNKEITSGDISNLNEEINQIINSFEKAPLEISKEEKNINTISISTSLESNLLGLSSLNIEKAWKEDYAFRNKPAINKFKKNASISYYFTPSLGFRSFLRHEDNQYSTSSLAVARGSNDNALLIDDVALNLEVGSSLNYRITKDIKLKTGLQANYTNYISNVTELGHPAQTYLSTTNGGSVIRSTNYSTKPGKDKINKTTMQVSLPIGADIRIAGKGNLKWYAGATIQPTYIISGSAFVLSADEKYYITEKPLLRKINLNTGIETYLSFKSSAGVTLNVGPQFRYQLLSTYKQIYNYSEKVYNIGVKVGISTTF